MARLERLEEDNEDISNVDDVIRQTKLFERQMRRVRVSRSLPNDKDPDADTKRIIERTREVTNRLRQSQSRQQRPTP